MLNYKFNDVFWIISVQVDSYMPKYYKERYPFTMLTIDVTEIFVEQPALPEL